MLLCKWSLICVCFISYGQKWHLLFLWYFPAASYTGLMCSKSKKTYWLMRIDLGFQPSLFEKQSPLIFFFLCIVPHTDHNHINPVLCRKLSVRRLSREQGRKCFLREILSKSTTAFRPEVPHARAQAACLPPGVGMRLYIAKMQTKDLSRPTLDFSQIQSQLKPNCPQNKVLWILKFLTTVDFEESQKTKL